jgi:hypothetical protein
MFTKIKALGSALIVAVVSLTVVPAQAALPAEATSSFTAIFADAQALEALAWPTMIGIVTIFVVMKLFRRAVNKAT